MESDHIKRELDCALASHEHADSFEMTHIQCLLESRGPQGHKMFNQVRLPMPEGGLKGFEDSLKENGFEKDFIWSDYANAYFVEASQFEAYMARLREVAQEATQTPKKAPTPVSVASFARRR